MRLYEVTALVAAGESETLELKTTTGTRRDATRTACAFLNQGGGQVLFGVTSDGDVVGQQVSERTIEELSAELRRIDPPAFPKVERVPVDGGREVILVSTARGASRPYSYRGTAYRRIGNTTLGMSADEYNRMLFERMHSEQRWENQPAAGWSVDDLDAAEIRRTVAEAVRRGRLEEPVSGEPTDLLRGLGLLRDGVLLRAAAVLFGSTERLEFEMPQCLLRIARFRGLDRMEFLDNRQFNGNAFMLLANAERFLRDTLPIAGRFEQDRFERIDEPLYPPLATREALANALCHRDYSIGGGSVGIAVYDDRLEVTSSGSLHFGLTPEKLFGPHESRPWNPLIARTFYRRGIIEEWGSGTLKMAELASSAGLPGPEIEDDGGAVTVRFRHGRFVPQRRSGEAGPAERQEDVLALLDGAPDGLTRREIHARLGPGVSERQVRRILEELRDRGLVMSPGRGRSGRWRREQGAC
ncbi:MAG: putative DNA binding domain-containing protein [Chloroflexi bacterium]|nr:putative DNA binding domain-containing protein [Chloroflexota bacterium]MCY4111368.1 putative DNA binding domain-containing protein [Chloroflexota bacterium]